MFEIAPVCALPFPHALADQWLDADLYERLRRSFPHCPPNTGPTGFTLSAGDADYDRLIADDEAWARFCGLFHGQAFIDYALTAFDETFAHQARVDLSDASYIPFRESREDKELGGLAQVPHQSDELWVRVDIMQGRKGYYRHPHLDHRRRALSMLIYFCDADEAGMKGEILSSTIPRAGPSPSAPPQSHGHVPVRGRLRPFRLENPPPVGAAQLRAGDRVELRGPLGRVAAAAALDRAKGRLRNLAVHAGLR